MSLYLVFGFRLAIESSCLDLKHRHLANNVLDRPRLEYYDIKCGQSFKSFSTNVVRELHIDTDANLLLSSDAVSQSDIKF